MSRPLPVSIFAAFAVLNGVGTIVAAILAFLGSKTIWTAGGVGPNRVAIADLFGPLRSYTGWLLLLIAVVMLAFGFGLYTLKPWARLLGALIFGALACVTVVAVVWGIRHQQYGVVIGGLVKIALELALCWYLLSPGTARVFGK